MLKFAIAAASVFLIGLLFWVLCLNHIGVNEIGVAYDANSGDLTVQEESGWYLTSPMTTVVSLSVAPITVRIPSSARVINSKIVRFRKEGAIDYIRLQGHHYTSNMEMENILLGYAYSGSTYPFLEILQEAKGEALPPANK